MTPEQREMMDNEIKDILFIEYQTFLSNKNMKTTTCLLYSIDGNIEITFTKY